jgi:hypothetical protein
MKELKDFVSPKSLELFTALGIQNTTFLDHDPASWHTLQSYMDAREAAKSLRVAAERGVALITDFNSIITKDEEQKQYLLHVVEEHRKKYKTPKKSTLMLSDKKDD